MASSDRNREEEEEEEEEEEVSMEWIKNPDLKFEPTDEILTDYYLREKAAGRNDGIFGCIKQVDIYKFQPSELLSLAYDFGDGKKKMYFVTTLKMKYGKGRNVDRLIKDNIGFWKITGKISYVEKDGRKIASKTPLAYHINKTSDKPEKSQWLMTEYRLIEDQSNIESERLALCVIYFHETEGVREEKNKQSSVYEKGEGSNSKTIATETASSSLPLTSISIDYFDHNKPATQNWQLGLGYQPSFQECIEIPSPAYFSHSWQLGLTNQPSFQECLEIPSPAYFGQNMPVMDSQGSNYPYQNMPYPVMEPSSNYPYQNMPYQVMGSQGSNFVQNIPNLVMELHGATASDSNLELSLETIADLQHWLPLPTEDSCEYQTWKRRRF